MRLFKLNQRHSPAAAGASALTAIVANAVRDVGRRLEGLLRKQVETELLRFYSRLGLAVAASSDRFPESQQDPDVRFALTELGPARIQAALQYLAPCDERDYVSLIEFLRGAGDGVDYDVAHAEDVEEVGDAVLRGLDNLNDFLLSNDLVEPGYRRAQARRPVLFRAFRDEARRQSWRPRRSASPARRHIQQFTSDDRRHRVAVS